MPYDTTDAITEEEVRSVVEPRIEEQLQFREAFRQVSVPETAGSTWKFVDPDETLGEPDEIQPGTDYPAMEEDFSKISVDRRKFAGRIPILDEAGMDNTFDVVAEQTEAAARNMQEKLNGEAYNHLSSNLNSDSPVGDDGGSMDYEDLLQGKRALRVDGFNPDLAIVDPYAEKGILNDNNFTHATPSGDDVVQNGEVARAAGMDVLVSNTGDISDNDAYVVDTDRYGYEAVWQAVETDDFRDENKDITNYKLRTYMNWVDIRSDAAIKVQG